MTDRVDSLLLWFSEVGRDDADLVGGKGASLGELYRELVPQGVRVPNGFTATATAYRTFLAAALPRETWLEVPEADGLPDLKAEVMRRAGTLRAALESCFEGANPEDHLEMHARTKLARDVVVHAPVPADVDAALRAGYRQLCAEYGAEVDVAVRSSATVEDSEEASFAGQCESYLNVHGEDAVVLHWKHCCASLFTERAVSYQVAKELDPLDASLAVVVMKMVRSDLATSGVMFTLDPDSGHRGVVHVSSSYGLGELVVQGSVSPDHFTVWKEGLRNGYSAIVHRHLGAKDIHMVYASQGGTSTESIDTSSARRRQWSLTREEIGELARMALKIEEHYGQPMDIEWAKDGRSQDLFVVQARPETVHARSKPSEIVRYSLPKGLARQLAADGRVLAEGQAVGTRIGSGRVRLYKSYEEVILKKRALRERIAAGETLDSFSFEERVFDAGDVLVTEMTTPDWEPLMKDASLIITEKGGRTSHAAIIAREFGIPAIVGCEDATKKLEPLAPVTGTCAEGDVALVFDGIHPFEIERTEIDTSVELETKIKLNVGFPAKALEDSQLPVDGVGLARLEFILTAEVGVHPLALLYREELQDFLERGTLAPELKRFREAIEAEPEEELRGMLGAIDRRTAAYADKRQFFVDRVMEGVGLICAAFHPRPVLVRLSDLKSNEYRELLGGRIFEPVEENPMIAWRGASRYVDPDFLPAFEMECDALRLVKRRLGLDNLELMVPFCRTPEEGAVVQQLLSDRGLGPEAGVKLFLMIELPSNVIEAERFIDAMALDGGSIGSNDLVQTVYAVSRDDLEGYRHPVDARSPAVKSMIREAVTRFTSRGLEIGICGQAPSDHPDEVPPFLVDCGISSISVTPDTALQARIAVARAEAARRGEPDVSDVA